MDRRKFIQLLTTSAVGLYALDPDKLLWMPGEKTIFIPPTKQLIFASEIVAAEWEKVMSVIGDLFTTDKLLYEIVADKPNYRHESGDYRTIQIYHGFEVKK